MRKIIFITFALLGLILIGASFLAGFLLKEKMAPPLEESALIISHHFLASGKIAEILDQTLILKKDQKTLKIPISKQARVQSLELIEKEGKTFAQQKELKFKDLKVGDRVQVLIDATKKTFQGTHITLFPD